jgi:hypothetical protein
VHNFTLGLDITFGIRITKHVGYVVHGPGAVLMMQLAWQRTFLLKQLMASLPVLRLGVVTDFC